MATAYIAAMRNVWIAFALALVLIVGSSFNMYRAASLEKLMKKMNAYLEAEKANIQTGKPALKFPVSQSQFSKAKGPERKIVAEHQQYIDGFYTELDKYYNVTSIAERKAAFNVVVNSCINCHQHECPGPIIRIKKSLF